MDRLYLPGRDLPWKTFLRELVHEADTDNLLDFASSVAYSAFLALFPFLLFAVALAGLVIDPATLDTLVGEVRAVAPAAVADILTDRLNALSGARPGLITIGAVGAIWAASGAVAALITALDSAYDVAESRPFWKTRGLSVLVTIGAAVVFVVASGIALVTPAVTGALPAWGATLVLWLRWPVAAAIMLLLIAGLYYLLPDVEQRFRYLTPGSAVALLGWLLASVGFSVYVGHFASYEVVYGALGSVIVLLLWMWLSAMAILVGAEVNAVLEHHAPEGKRTGGRSMADRGADAPETAKRG